MDEQITYCDVIRAGACIDGAIEACIRKGVFVSTVSEAIATFPNERRRILIAANLDGYGYGIGNGYGYGDGYSDGDGGGELNPAKD